MSLYHGDRLVLPCTLHFPVMASHTSVRRNLALVPSAFWAPVVYVCWVCNTRSGKKVTFHPHLHLSQTDPCDLFMSVTTKILIGDVSYCGGKERWSASCEDGVDIVLCAVSAGKMVGDVGYCTPNPMDVCEDPP